MPNRTRRGRIRLIAVAAALACVASTSLAAPPAASGMTKAKEYRNQLLDHSASAPMMAVAHLGAWRDSSENSLTAISRAATLGVPINEIDLQVTRDNRLVVMHDSSVNRTTARTGLTTSFTLDELRGMQLRTLRGGSQAPLTNAKVPSFDDALNAAKDKILINVDKEGWNQREAVWAAASAKGMQRQIVFKSDRSAGEVKQFRDAHPEALYCHIVRATNYQEALTMQPAPHCYEVIYTGDNDAIASRDSIDALRNRGARVWVNTMWRGLAGSNTDEGSLRDPALGWARVKGLGASMIQTDLPSELQHWIRTGSTTNVGLPAGGVRVAARNFTGGAEGVAYHDVEPADLGGKGKPGQGVDVCDTQGAIHLCYIRGGEWVKYTVAIPSSGTYRVKARTSSKYADAGSFRLEFPGLTTAYVRAQNTTQHEAFLLQDVSGGVPLNAGQVTFTFRVAAGQSNFNVDYFQFEKI